MDEIGIDMTRHQPKSIEDLEDTSFDLIVTLAPEAHHQALELTRTMAVDVEYWPTMEPSATAGNREQIMQSYRVVRDQLFERIKTRFGLGGAPQA
jgi:protein-tyrosine-phosphatase